MADDEPFERPAAARWTRWVTGALGLALAAGLTLALRPEARAPDPAPTEATEATPPASDAGTDTDALLPVGDDAVDSDPQTDLLGSWTPLPEAPIGPRWGAQAVWTGGEAIIWGGYGRVPPDGTVSQDSDPRTHRREVLAELAPLRDGAAFDPATARWRAIARAPAAIPAAASALWTGEEMLVIGGPPGEPLAAWAYDPTQDTWRTLPPGPLPGPAGPLLVWTGSEALVWSRDAAGGLAHPGAALDPVTGTWRGVAPGPRFGIEVAGTWTGEELLIWDETAGVAYDPAADAWRQLDDPPAPMRPVARVVVAVSDDLLLAGAYPRLDVAAYGYRYRPSARRWEVQPLPEPPDDQFPAISAVPAGDDHAVVLHRYGRGPTGGEAFRWTRASGAWERLTSNPMLQRLATAEVWTGEELILWGGLHDEPQTGGAAWHPAGP